MSTVFDDMLKTYRTAIDADIAAYAAHARRVAREQYGDAAGEVSAAFLDMLQHGGKRLRGTLTIVGYEMLGGQDAAMITRTATAMEMLHAYMIIVDDIQDRSRLRRGRSTVHEVLAKSSLAGGDAHIGESLALNAALGGGHAAQMLLAGLQAEPELIRKVLGIVNHTMVVTSHGQTYDLLYGRSGAQPTMAQLEQVLYWKTAEYTFLNPLCVGMVLAGAGCDDTNAIRGYALESGAALQIADDLRGVFGGEAATGKEAAEDIREGKRTMLIQYALGHAVPEDRDFLKCMLGNVSMTSKEFNRCRVILEASGARTHAKTVCRQHIEAAVTSLAYAGRRWPPAYVHFLEALVYKLAEYGEAIV